MGRWPALQASNVFHYPHGFKQSINPSQFSHPLSPPQSLQPNVLPLPGLKPSPSPHLQRGTPLHDAPGPEIQAMEIDSIPVKFNPPTLKRTRVANLPKPKASEQISPNLPKRIASEQISPEDFIFPQDHNFFIDEIFKMTPAEVKQKVASLKPKLPAGVLTLLQDHRFSNEQILKMTPAEAKEKVAFLKISSLFDRSHN